MRLVVPRSDAIRLAARIGIACGRGANMAGARLLDSFGRLCRDALGVGPDAGKRRRGGLNSGRES
jgi:hypothetical protein